MLQEMAKKGAIRGKRDIEGTKRASLVVIIIIIIVIIIVYFFISYFWYSFSTQVVNPIEFHYTSK